MRCEIVALFFPSLSRTIRMAQQAEQGLGQVTMLETLGVLSHSCTTTTTMRGLFSTVWRHSRALDTAEWHSRPNQGLGQVTMLETLGVLFHSCTTTTTMRNLVFSHSMHIRTNPSFRARTQRYHPHFIFPSPLPVQNLCSTLRSLSNKYSLVHGSPCKKRAALWRCIHVDQRVHSDTIRRTIETCMFDMSRT